MDAAPNQVSASVFVEQEHPRSSTGQFGTKSKPASQQPAKKATPAKTTPKRPQRKRRVIPKGQLGFDGVSGTGYGMRGGDRRVKELQAELNRLGLTDLHGRRLAVDGKLGPLTTSAIKKAQQRLGMKATGIIDPSFIARLRATKAMQKAAAKKTTQRRVRPDRLQAKFNPDQLRDFHGRWADRPGGMSMVRDWADLGLNDGSNDEVAVTAVTDTPGGRRLVLGFAGDEYFNSDDGADASPSADSTVALDHAAARQLDSAIAEVQAKGAERQEQLKAAYAEQDRLAARVQELLRPGERDPQFKLSAQAAEERAQAEDRIAAIDAEIGEPDAVFASGRVAADGGDIEWSAWTGDGSDPDLHMHLELPAGGLFLDEGDMARTSAVLKSAFLDDMPVTAASPVVAAELRGIELARPGKWNLASGPMEITDRHITDAARYAQRKGARPGYVKIGHSDKRFEVGDGEPALGWVENVRREVDDLGPKLVGDINDMPEWLAATAPKAWPYRSMEGWADYTDPDTGEKFALVLDGVALLGVTPPGMTSLQSLRDLPKAVGVAAASGVRVVASMASAPVAVEEGAGPMDPAKTRDALGLAADASDDEVRSAMAVALQSLGGDAGPAQQPVQASLFGDEPTPAPKATAMPTLPKGVEVIASSKLAELNETIRSLAAFVEKTKRNERDDVIAKAVQAGKFTPAQKPDFVRAWDEAPDATRALIEKLPSNKAFAVVASGYSGGVEQEEDELDREIKRLSRPEVFNG